MIFACIDTFPPGQKPHLRGFFLVYARLTPPSWQMLQIQAGFTMFYPLGICYSLTNKEIVDLPNLKIAIFHSYVSLPGRVKV